MLLFTVATVNDILTRQKLKQLWDRFKWTSDLKSTNVSSIYRWLCNGLHFIYYRIWGQNHRKSTLIEIVPKPCKVFNFTIYLAFFSKSNQNCFYILFVTGVFCKLYTSLLISTLYKDFSTWIYYFKELVACFNDFLKVNMKYFLERFAPESQVLRIFAFQKTVFP